MFLDFLEMLNAFFAAGKFNVIESAHKTKENTCALKCTQNDNEREIIENGNAH